MHLKVQLFAKLHEPIIRFHGGSEPLVASLISVMDQEIEEAS